MPANDLNGLSNVALVEIERDALVVLLGLSLARSDRKRHLMELEAVGVYLKLDID